MNLTFGKWFHNVKNKSKIVLTFDKIILHWQQQQQYNIIINNIRELAMFLIQCGARVRPWSWLQTSNLPEPLRRDAKLQVREILGV